MSQAAGAGESKKRIQATGWIAWGVVSLFYLYEFLIRVAPSVMQPELQKSFHLNAAGLGAALGAYYYIYAPLQLAVGGMLDRWGSRRVLVPAMLFCSIGCFLELIGGGSMVLVTARLCQGAGSAFAFVGAMTAAAEWFPAERMAMISGLTTALGMVGAIVGNAAVAAFVQTFGWRVSLRDAALAGLVVAAAIFFFLPHKRGPFAPERGDKSLAHTIISNLKTVFSNPQTWLIGLVASALYVPLSVFGGLWGVPYLVAVSDISTVEASQVIAALYVGWLVGGPMVGWLSDHLGHRRIMLMGAALLTFLMSLFLSVFPPGGTVSMVILLLAIGLASSAQVVGFAAGLEANPQRCTATSIAVVNMIVMLVGGLLQPAFGFLLDHFATDSAAVASGQYSAGDFRVAILILPATSLIAVVLSLFMKETYGQDREKVPMH